MPVRSDPAGVMLRVWVQPRASRTEAVGIQDDAVRIRLTAPPAGGEANRELVRFLADVLGVPKRAVEIVRGHTARRKIVRIRGADEAEVRRVLGLG